MPLNSTDLVLVETLKALLASSGGVCRSDNRHIKSGDVFFAWAGQKHDARQYLAQAEQSGAVAAVIDAAPSNGAQWPIVSIPVYTVEHLQAKAGALVSLLLDQPSGAMTGIAVTGTNGKTSVTRWVAQALEHLGVPCAVVGTLGAGRVDNIQSVSGLTTPDAIGLQHTFKRLLDDECEAFSLEASSIGLDQSRMAGTLLKVVGFTNLSRDHLDYHQTMQAYGEAKLKLANWPSASHVVVNADDPFSEQFVSVAKAAGKQVITVSARQSNLADNKTPVDLRLSNVTYGQQGVQGVLHDATTVCDFSASVIGQFNMENLAVTAGILSALGYSLTQIADAFLSLTPPPGRMGVIALPHKPMVVVDYAHTPDALQKALEALAPVAASRQGNLSVLFGCGGDRDPGKRPVMGEVACRGAHTVVITSDNPRTEAPHAIIQQIVQGAEAAGFANFRVEADRKKAIQDLIHSAAPSDVLLLAGKGHETTQTIGDTVLPFSDAEAAWACLQDYQETLQ